MLKFKKCFQHVQLVGLGLTLISIQGCCQSMCPHKGQEQERVGDE